MEAGPPLAALASAIDEKMTDEKIAALGIPEEDRAYSPHLTLGTWCGRFRFTALAQGRDGPNRAFERLQEKLTSLPSPEFGAMTPREFFLYQSQLSPKGSKYTKLERFALQQP